MKRVFRKEAHRKGSNCSISMYDLDRSLAKYIKAAQKEPLSVERYGSRYICIVAQALWDEVDILKNTVPPEHVLVGLRVSIDSLFGNRRQELQALSERCESGLQPEFLIRGLVLEELYSVQEYGQLYDALIYNKLWRWFVGYERCSERMPEKDLFVRDMILVGMDRDIAANIREILNKPLKAGSSDSSSREADLESPHAYVAGAGGITDIVAPASEAVGCGKQLRSTASGLCIDTQGCSNVISIDRVATVQLGIDF